MNSHRSAMRCSKNRCLIYQHSHLDDQGNPRKCTLNDFTIQPIEILAKNTKKDDRLKKEEWWMKELKTLYPYGLNDKCGNTYFSNYHKENLVYSVFNKYVVKRQKRAKRKKKKSNVQEKVENFIETLICLIKDEKNWRQFCYSFLIGSPRTILTQLKIESELPKCITENKDVSIFMSDLINKRFEHQKKPPPSNILKIYFDNKGIEHVNIPSLL